MAESCCNKACIVQGEKYRFSVLTPFMMRMEYSETGVFEDLQTQTVLNREFPVPEYTVTQSDDRPAAPVPISRKMIRICCRRIAIDMAAPYTVSTIPAPVVVRRSWSMATWPLTMHQSRPVAFWAGFVKVA